MVKQLVGFLAAIAAHLLLQRVVYEYWDVHDAHIEAQLVDKGVGGDGFGVGEGVGVVLPAGGGVKKQRRRRRPKERQKQLKKDFTRGAAGKSGERTDSWIGHCHNVS